MPQNGTGQAVGFINPTRRRQLANAMMKSLEERGIAATKLGTPEGVKEGEHFFAMHDMVKKYPHTGSHLAKLQPESTGMKLTTEGDFSRGSASMRTVKDLNQYRDYTFNQALDKTRAQYPGTAYFADTDQTRIPSVLNYNQKSWVDKVQSSKDQLIQWAQDFLPNPRYHIRTNLANTTNAIIPKVLKHEFGHEALTLKDDPTALGYLGNTNRYGYWANPDEVRARAVAAKSEPRITNPGPWISDTSIRNKGMGTYHKNDYMNRIMIQMAKAREYSTPEQRQAVLDDIESMKYNMPNAFYDRLTKPGSDNYDWLKYNWSK